MKYEFKATPQYHEEMLYALKKHCKSDLLRRLIIKTTGADQSIDNLDWEALDAIFDCKECPVMRPQGICESLISENGYYKIPVSWTATAVIQVEADNLEDAIKRAKNAELLIPLPTENVEYREDSFRIDIDEDEDAINTADAFASEVCINKNGEVTN